ncbi:MAG: methyltransferase domain-containing protein [Candidatus Hydrogenedentota bacterium]|nr:MAG: methyltransferase domain-containing protein [Candidatus Hydrogenedentota bacterium]
MTDPLARDSRAASRMILEVGAGTGVITEEIVPLMSPRDRLVVYELSERLGERLKYRAKGPEWSGRDIEIRVKPFPEGTEDEHYNFAVCSLPFNNFPAYMVHICLKTFSKILTPGGVLTFYEYCHLRNLRLQFANRKEFIRLRRIDRTVKSFLKTHHGQCRHVLINVPPAWVYTIRF